MQVRFLDLQVLRQKARIHPVQGQQTLTQKCVKCGQEHVTTSRICPKKLKAENKAKTSHTPAPKTPTVKQCNRDPAPIPLTNAWATVGKRPFSKTPSTPQTTTSNVPMELSTKHRRFQDHHPIYTNQAASHKHTTNKTRKNKLTMYWKNIALSGAISLLRIISTGNTLLVPALNKIMEAVMDAINTLTIYMIMLFPISAPIKIIHTLEAEEGKLFKKPAFLKATQIFFQKCVKVMELFPTHLPIQDDQRHQMERADQNPIISWYIGMHKKQLQTILQSRQLSFQMTLI